MQLQTICCFSLEEGLQDHDSEANQATFSNSAEMHLNALGEMRNDSSILLSKWFCEILSQQSFALNRDARHFVCDLAIDSLHDTFQLRTRTQLVEPENSQHQRFSSFSKGPNLKGFFNSKCQDVPERALLDTTLSPKELSPPTLCIHRWWLAAWTTPTERERPSARPTSWRFPPAFSTWKRTFMVKVKNLGYKSCMN